MAGKTARAEFAPAKVNLTLRVLGRRADGYHELESLVVFAGIGDDLSFVPDRELSLDVEGPTAAGAGDISENLVIRASKALAARVDGLRLGHFILTKRLPVAAGLGGGSSDAAAALRLLAAHNRLPLDDPRVLDAARATGADVPVCLDPRARVMRGIGEILSAPVEGPAWPAVLVNPGVAVPTAGVFRKLAEMKARAVAASGAGHNDLEAPAISLQPVIADVLAALTASPRHRFAAMSGSGATCFGLFGNPAAARRAARRLRKLHPDWWVEATVFNPDGGLPIP